MTAAPPDLIRHLQTHFDPAPPALLGVAVSGGGDSMALLAALAQWRAAGGPDLRAVTVDHGLRPEAADEAAFVGRICAQMDIGHRVLVWRGWDGQGNLADRARRARYGLMADWAREQGLADLALGHTRDDQAETVLMRLARGSGVDGLSGMAAQSPRGGLILHRPFLDVPRAALRAYLIARGLDWCEDPGNADPRHDRVRARRVLAQLADLGVDAAGIAATADRLRMARAALDHAAGQAARLCCRIADGDLCIDRAELARQPAEISRRLVQAAVAWIGGAGYPPRAGALGALCAALRDGVPATLQGCLGYVCRGQYRLTREYEAVRDLRGTTDTPWDGRWRFSGPSDRPVEIRALGPQGWRQLADRGASPLPYRSAIAAPAVWDGGRLVAAPLAGQAGDWQVRMCRPSGFLSPADGCALKIRS